MLRFLGSRWRPLSHCALLGGAAIALVGCSGLGDTLSRNFGLTRDSPDEFSVTTQAPLAMPPDYSIRPPLPGAPRPQDVPDRQQAEQALIPQTALTPQTAQMSPGLEALRAAGGPPAPANIRAEIARDRSLNNPGESFADQLMFWRPAPLPGIVVDPTKEAQRLRQNSALGQSPELGETPIIQPKPRGWLQGIF
jgi:hypothetical protein